MTDDQEHIVTATEPAWVQQGYKSDDGVPEPINDPEVQDGIDMLYDEASYECTCDAELDSWFDVEEHLAEVAEDD